MSGDGGDLVDWNGREGIVMKEKRCQEPFLGSFCTSFCKETEKRFLTPFCGTDSGGSSRADPQATSLRPGFPRLLEAWSEKIAFGSRFDREKDFRRFDRGRGTGFLAEYHLAGKTAVDAQVAVESQE